MSTKNTTRSYLNKAQKNYYIFKEFVSLPEEVIIKDFEQIISEQKKNDLLFTDTFETVVGNIFQDIGSSDMQKSAYTAYHTHDYYEINYINSGICYQYVNGKYLKLKKGDFLIMSPLVPHSCYLTPYSEGTNFYISKYLFDKITSDLSVIKSINFMKDIQHNSSYYLFHTKGVDLLSNIFPELIKYSHKSLTKETSNRLRTEKALNFIFFELHCRMVEQQIKFETNSSVLTNSNDDFSNITKYISNNLSTVNRQMVENYFGYSAMGLYRIMQRNGTTFQEHTTAIRVQRAKYLLKHSTLPITEIAKSLGFASNAYFCRFFQKHRNMSPSEYREKYAHDGVTDTEINFN